MVRLDKNMIFIRLTASEIAGEDFDNDITLDNIDFGT